MSTRKHIYVRRGTTIFQAGHTAHGSGYTTLVNLQNHVFYLQKIKYADMAELADAHGSGPCESNFMQVQVLLSAP